MKIRHLLFRLLYLAVNLTSLYFILGLLFIFGTSLNGIFIPEHFYYLAPIISNCLVLFIECLLMLGIVFLINLLLLTVFGLVYEANKIAKKTFIIEVVFVFALIILVMGGIYSTGT